MRLGAICPQLEIGNDPIAIRDWAQTAEGLGYDHILQILALARWRALGATHVSVNFVQSGLATPQEQIAALRHIKEIVSG